MNKLLNLIKSILDQNKDFNKKSSVEEAEKARPLMQNRNNKIYSSQEMIDAAKEWTNLFVLSAPIITGAAYDKDEIYMFICWILLDYGKGHGYLDKNSNIHTFWDSVYQAVRNTGEYEQSEYEQFMFRIEQYKWQIREMLKCNYPKTKMFFPETLYARFVNVDFDHYHHSYDFGIDPNLIRFSEYIGTFWNKINHELLRKYPKQK